MTPPSGGGVEDQYVTWKDFATRLEELNARYMVALETVRSLAITLASNSDGLTRAQCSALSAEIKVHVAEVDRYFDKFADAADKHEKVDQGVADRVLRLEEGQKRLTWIFAIALPSFIASWEWLRTKIFP